MGCRILCHKGNVCCFDCTINEDCKEYLTKPCNEDLLSIFDFKEYCIFEHTDLEE